MLRDFETSYRNKQQYSWHVATIKAATIKSKHRKNDFRETDLPLPFDPVIRRRATCLELHCTIANIFLLFVLSSTIWTGGGLLVSRAKEAIHVDILVPDLALINRYRTLAAKVAFLEVLGSKWLHYDRSIRLIEKYPATSWSLLNLSLDQETITQI